MAVEKHHFSDDYNADNQKHSHVTITIDNKLRNRIRTAALKNNQSVSEYIGEILDQVVPDEIDKTLQQQLIPYTIVDFLYQVRSDIIRESEGQLFENSVDVLRRAREERIAQIEQLRNLL